MRDRWMTQDWTTGDLNSLVKNLGGEEIARKIQQGKLKLTFQDPVKILFDKHGRRIPDGLQTNFRDPNRDFHLVQPKLNQEVDFANRILRLHGCLGIDTGVNAEQLKSETERLLAIINANPQIANIVKGVYLPVIMPKLVNNDFGTELEWYLSGVANSYAKTFGDFKFKNHRKDALVNEVSVIRPGTRHRQLIEKMKQCPVIGLHFPNSLQGFSVNADREQMSTLPEGFILSGMDTAITMVMYPDILARDWNTPGMDLAALQWRASGSSLRFRAYDGGLDFDGTDALSGAYDNYSGGLVFLG